MKNDFFAPVKENIFEELKNHGGTETVDVTVLSMENKLSR